MPNVEFWRERFRNLAEHAVGPGDTNTEAELEAHRRIFLREVWPFLNMLKGPVLDFGCGIGRWVRDLPRPYLGVDLLPEHVAICERRYGSLDGVRFGLSGTLTELPEKSFNSIFTCTVLQHIVHLKERRAIIANFAALLAYDGVLLAVEWNKAQPGNDWVSAVTSTDFRQYFRTRAVAEVVESGRKHTVWLCRPRARKFILLW